MKAKDAMEVLDISKPTFYKYVKQGLIEIDSEINGKKRYNDESVYSLLKYKNGKNSEIK